ncbi:MAG: DUF4440 domain-containing protein [Bacteroidia bacterium]
MKRIFYFLLLPALACSQSSSDIYTTVNESMKAQEKCWNSFDIDGFMNYYWKSDSLMFIGSKGITYGWSQTLSNYKKSYSTKELMGELHFENLSFDRLCDSVIQVIGKWKIIRKDGSDIGGIYTLLWKYIDNKWVIVKDHTS